MQHTLRHEVAYTGIGLHSGQKVTMTLKPAPVNTGIVFVRVDLPGRPHIPASYRYITDTHRATTIGYGGARVHTAEHLLAALAALRIDNAIVELDAAEPPVGDGSAKVFVELIVQAGMEAQNADRRVTFLTAPVWVCRDDKYIIAIPSDSFRISFTFVNPHPLIGVQYADYTITPGVFMNDIAPARTMGFMHEVAALQAQGLGLGGSLENTVVYDSVNLLTPLRFPDELVRHKVLDIIGDLSLIGAVQAHIVAVKSSHALNAELARAIAAANSEKL